MKGLRRTCAAVLLTSCWAGTAYGSDEIALRQPHIGMYLTALRFHVPDGSFDADFWLWATLPAGSEWNPFETIEVVDASRLELRYPATVERIARSGGEYPAGSVVTWHTRWISATLPYVWDLHNYPFDRHTLPIALEESVDDIDRVSYVADVAESRVAPELSIDGWTITGFRLVASEREYPTTFGDPVLPSGGGSTYTRITALVDIERDSLVSFAKLTCGVYVAFLIAALSFWLDTHEPGLTNPRIGMLVGALFAAMVNMRFAAQFNLVGNEAVTLVDRIHLVTLGFLLLASVMAIASRLVGESGRPALARILDRRVAFWLYLVGFVAINVGMIADAATEG